RLLRAGLELDQIGRTGRRPRPADRQEPDGPARRHLYAEVQIAHRHGSDRHFPARARRRRDGAVARGEIAVHRAEDGRPRLLPYWNLKEQLASHARLPCIRESSPVIPGRTEGANPESRNLLRALFWIPGPPLRGVPE